MKLLVLTTLLALATADVSHLGYQFRAPEYSQGAEISNYGLSGSSTPSSLLNSGFGLTTPAPSLDLNQGFVSSTPAPAPLGSNVEFQGFNFGANQGLVSSTPAPTVDLNSLSYSTTARPLGSNGGFQGFNFGANQGLVSSTPAPSVDLNSLSFSTTAAPLGLNGGFQGFNFGADQGLVSSTVAPNVEINPVSLSAPAAVDSGFQGFNFNGELLNARLGYNSFSTAAPQVGLGSNSFVRQSASSGGSIGDAFGEVSGGSYDQVHEQEVAKHVYFYSAPEEHEQVRTRINVAPAQSAKKNVKYIFIKAPSAPSAGPIEIAPPPQTQEKTVVYVLVKKPEEEQQIYLKSPEPTAAAKPEVFFIKYKNQQEAEEAISKVQSGQAGPGTHQAAQDLSGSDHLIETINRESSNRAQPIINYVKEGKPNSPLNAGYISSNVVPNAGFNAGFAQTTSLPVFNQGISYTTPAPGLNLNSGFQGFSYTTPAPNLNLDSAFNQFQFNSPSFGSGFSYSTPIPTVNIGGQRAFDFHTGVDLSQNLIPSDFGKSIVSSTEAPAVVSSTVAPESSSQSEAVETASPESYSSYDSQYKKRSVRRF